MDSMFLQDNYTHEEYQALAETITSNSTNRMLNETAVTAKRWLESWDYEFLKNVLHCPLEDVPLRINDESYLSRVITQWRLKIAR